MFKIPQNYYFQFDILEKLWNDLYCFGPGGMSSFVCQYWFRLWFGAVRQQVKFWANVDSCLCRHIASLGDNELIQVIYDILKMLQCSQRWSIYLYPLTLQTEGAMLSPQFVSPSVCLSVGRPCPNDNSFLSKAGRVLSLPASVCPSVCLPSTFRAITQKWFIQSIRNSFEAIFRLMYRASSNMGVVDHYNARTGISYLLLAHYNPNGKSLFSIFSSKLFLRVANPSGSIFGASYVLAPLGDKSYLYPILTDTIVPKYCFVGS